MSRRRPLLAATLIVRDEVRDLGDCLASMAGLVDEIVVYDTGSCDGTPELARAMGARVQLGYWDDDFARARNAALDAATAEWVLIVDADERVVADAHVLRRLLQGTQPHDPPVPAIDAFLLPVVHVSAHGEKQAVQLMTRLFRAERGHWQGRVHEAVVLDRPDALRHPLPGAAALIEHLGYPDADAIRAKAERNLALGQAELDHLVASGSEDRDVGARVLLDLARSFLALDRKQDAVDALETLREITTDGLRRAMATALLAQVLLDAGGFEEAALVLEAELRAGGHADPRQADWLRAQALAGLGYDAEALELLHGIDGMLDPAGIPQPMNRVHGVRAMLAARLERSV